MALVRLLISLLVVALTTTAAGQSVTSTVLCDNRGVFQCATGTCYTGLDGFVGCCTVSSCKPRTTCVDYNVAFFMNVNTDIAGIVYCSNRDVPACNTLSNTIAKQYILWCGETGTLRFTGYTNFIKAGSVATDLPTPFNTAVLLPPSWTETSISAAATPSSHTPALTAIASTSVAASTPSTDKPDTTSTSNTDDLSLGTKIGIGIGGATAGFVCATAIGWFVWIVLRGRDNANASGPAESQTRLARPTEPTPPPSSSDTDWSPLPVPSATLQHRPRPRLQGLNPVEHSSSVIRSQERDAGVVRGTGNADRGTLPLPPAPVANPEYIHVTPHERPQTPNFDTRYAAAKAGAAPLPGSSSASPPAELPNNESARPASLDGGRYPTPPAPPVQASTLTMAIQQQDPQPYPALADPSQQAPWDHQAPETARREYRDAPSRDRR